MHKNLLYYLLPSIVRGGANLFIVIPLTTYYLDPYHFGIVGIITVFSGIVTPLSSVGLVWVLGGNYFKISTRERAELIFNALVVNIILRTVWVLLLGIGAYFLLPLCIVSFKPQFILFFWLFLGAEWLNSLWEVVSYVIILQKRGGVFTLCEVFQTIIHLGVLSLCLVGLRLKTLSLVLANLGYALGGFIFSAVYIRRYIIKKINIHWIKESIKLTFPTIPQNLFNYLSQSLDRFFIERWNTLSQLGIYTHSLTYKKMFMIPIKAYSRTCSPTIIEIFSKSTEKETRVKIVRTFVRKWFGLLSIGGCGVVLFTREFLNLFTHGKFLKAYPLIIMWFILMQIYSFGLLYSQFFFAHKRMKFIILTEIIIGSIFWIIIAFLVKIYGIIGGGGGVIGYFFVLYSLRKWYALKLGCYNLDKNYFWISLGIMVGLLIFKVNMYPLETKISIWIIISILLTIFFKIVPFSKNIKRC